MALALIALGAGLASPTMAAAPAEGEPNVAIAPGHDRGVRVVVLDFASALPSDDALGVKLADGLTALLADSPRLVPLERETWSQRVREAGLELSDVVSTSEAVAIGQAVDAPLVVTGKVFEMKGKRFMTAKIVGRDTALVDGVLANGPQGSDVGPLLMEAADLLRARLRSETPRLTGDPALGDDPFVMLGEQLETLQKPVLALAVAPGAAQPALQTALATVLRDAGFTVRMVDREAGTDPPAGAASSDDADPAPSLAVEQILTIRGRGSVEYRIAGLSVAAAQAELTLRDARGGEPLFTARAASPGADVVDPLAVTAALRNAGRDLGLALLDHYAQTLPLAP